MSVLESIEAEYRRYKALAEAAMTQLTEEELSDSADGNSVTVIAWHIAGNLTSRFTDFLTTDGEKPWRNREEEFAPRKPSRQELLGHWERGWAALFQTLSGMSDEELSRVVTIRGTELTALEALHRSLGHVSYHVGQIVFAAREMRGSKWQFLSIPPGQTGAYNRNPTHESAEAHAARLERQRE